MGSSPGRHRPLVSRSPGSCWRCGLRIAPIEHGPSLATGRPVGACAERCPRGTRNWAVGFCAELTDTCVIPAKKGLRMSNQLPEEEISAASSRFQRLVRTPERPKDPKAEHGSTQYVKSYLLIRLVIGIIGIMLPLALFSGGYAFEDSKIFELGSLSAYYHTGVRDIFVGGLVLIGVFLMTYMAFEGAILDNTVSTLAGLAALGVALFPTKVPNPCLTEPHCPSQTRLQDVWSGTSVVHFACALVFILSLAFLSYCFGYREQRRPDRGNGAERASDRDPGSRPSLRRWAAYHYACSGIIIGAVVLLIASKLTGVLAGHSLLWAECITVWAFGLSWLAKGSELKQVVTEAR